MKVLNEKLFFKMALCIGLFLTFMTSCQKEVLEETSLLETTESIDENLMPKGRYVTDLHVSDPLNPTSSMVISVSTNSSQIYDQFVDENFEINTLDLGKMDRGGNEENVDALDTSSDVLPPNVDEHFMSIIIKGENHREGEILKITFGSELLAVMRFLRAKTHIKMSPEESLDRYSVYRNAFSAYGDGGSIRTKLKVRYRYSKYGTTYAKTTGSGFYNSYTFRSCKWPWNSSTRCKYTYFTVTQDVLSSYSRFTTSTCSSCI